MIDTTFILVVFAFGMIMGFIASAGLFRPRWVECDAQSEVEHEGLILLQYRKGTLEVVRNYYQCSTAKTGLIRYMKL